MAGGGARRSKPSECDGSACSCMRLRMSRNHRPGSWHLCKGCRNWGGPRPQRTDRHPLEHGDASRLRRDAAELVALAPDVVLAGVGATIPALLEATRTVPIVFAHGLDPVGAGFVESSGPAGR